MSHGNVSSLLTALLITSSLYGGIIDIHIRVRQSRVALLLSRLLLHPSWSPLGGGIRLITPPALVESWYILHRQHGMVR